MSWLESKIKDRKNWLKIKKLENDIFNIEYMDSIVGAGFKVWDAFFSAQWNRGISSNNKETAQRF